MTNDQPTVYHYTNTIFYCIQTRGNTRGNTSTRSNFAPNAWHFGEGRPTKKYSNICFTETVSTTNRLTTFRNNLGPWFKNILQRIPLLPPHPQHKSNQTGEIAKDTLVRHKIQHSAPVLPNKSYSSKINSHPPFTPRVKTLRAVRRRCPDRQRTPPGV